ncbi:MAG TPA: hypothetical protein VFC19_07015 [Candidatus Limnocylindrales bacterium]|nr:hypothetical protein [Candidatus Limnocylindrales bacterium]
MNRRLSLLMPLLVLVAAGCAPSEPFAPVAVRLRGQAPTILYVSCKPALVKGFKVVKPDPKRQWIEDTDPVVWQVKFDTPTKADTASVGEPVPGANEVVPLAQPLDEGTRYEAFVQLDDGSEPHIGFELAKLAGGKVSYEDEYLPESEFAKLSSCE